MGSYVKTEVIEQFMLIKLNRPDKLNALNRELHSQLQAALIAAKRDASVRAVILAGEGRAFCAGADLHEWLSDEDIAELVADPQDKEYYEVEIIADLGKPVVAALHGHVLGGGLVLALSCDVRIAAEGTMLGFPEVRWGGFACMGGTLLLGRLIGRGRALDMALTGEAVTADEALRIGLVNRVVPPARLLDASLDWARKVAAHSAAAVRITRESIIQGLEMPYAQAAKADLYRRYQLATTAERRHTRETFAEQAQVDR